MSELPIGTITFMFTDIEGSTRHLTSLGADFRRVVERHHQILRAAIDASGGVVVSTEGDAFFAVFVDAAAAVAAAIAAQRALLSEPWPGGAEVRVRMGLLTGQGERGGDNYVGLDVHRAARIASAAHGGQVVLADSTRGLVVHALPGDTSVRDLGEHRLKDLPRPERVYQLVVDGLPADFPPLRSLSARPNNLPALISSFVGRARQVAEISEELRSARLLTLTGPGGTGKTRLAIRVASELLDDFQHGCWFVPLETITEPDLVPSAIANALGTGLPGDRPPADALAEQLADRELLLVLDNLEQVEAGPTIAGLLTAAPKLRVLATSRTPLHVYGESEYPVPPLSVVSELRAAATSAEALGQYEAVQLFIERAVAAKPSFAVTNANAPAVAEICVRLDGLPLAIELAAARVKLLSPEQILARLDQSLAVLTSSASDLPERQRTLNGAIDWSYRMLTADEQHLLERLSVFSGGMSLEAVEQICGQDLGVDVFDGLASLVDKSLLRSVELADETRFAMLETIRQYAAELLAAHDDGHAEAVRRHAAFFFAMADAAEKELTGSNQVEWLDRLERDDDNLRAAFTAAPEVGMLDEALSSAGAIWRYWQQRGRFAEARSIYEHLLSYEGGSDVARAKALTGAGGIAYWQSDYETMTSWYHQASQLFEAAGDQAGLAGALINEAYIPLVGGDLATATEIATRSRDLYVDLGDELGEATAEGVIAMGTWLGDHKAAIPHIERAIAIFRRHKAKLELADYLTNLSFARAMNGEWEASQQALDESATIFAEAGNEVGVTLALSGDASLAVFAGDHARAAQLFGYVEAVMKRVGGAPPAALIRNGPFEDRARENLGEQEYERLYAAGSGLSQADAMALGRVRIDPGTPAFPGLGAFMPEAEAEP